MISTLIWVLLPLFGGFAIPVANPRLIRVIDMGLMALIYIILFIMGLNLSKIPNLATQLQSIFSSTALFIVMILGANSIALSLLDKQLPLPTKGKAAKKQSLLQLLMGSGKLLGSIILGLILGLWVKDWLNIPDTLGEIALVILLFFVGLQLRSGGIKLREVFLNRYGIWLSLFFVASSLIGGAIAAFILKMPVTQGLAIGSGFGWYSLSTIILQEAYGPIVGSIAFFNDLFREFFAFAVIPLLMRRYPLSAIGSGGATSLDFVLPVIQRTGGIEVVPIAISFGFITNILAPILLVLFSNMA